MLLNKYIGYIWLVMVVVCFVVLYFFEVDKLILKIFGAIGFGFVGTLGAIMVYYMRGGAQYESR